MFVAAAGLAAHLAGAVAAETIRPVIGVPIDAGPLKGLDALLSTVQMPAGIPVATVAIGRAGARNAAWLAAQILAVEDPRVAERLLKEGGARRGPRIGGREQRGARRELAKTRRVFRVSTDPEKFEFFGYATKVGVLTRAWLVPSRFGARSRSCARAG